MITANELRIGNLVEGTYGPSKVCSIGIMKDPKDAYLMLSYDDSYKNGLYIEAVKPIPITIEWLKRFGFKKLKWDIYTKGQIRIDMAYNEPFITITHCGIKLLKGKPYIHCLQNLYFMVMGEELVEVVEMEHS